MLEEEKTEFYNSCVAFYGKAISEIQWRFDFSDDYYTIVELIIPKNARSGEIRSLDHVFTRFPNLKEAVNPAQAEIEWRSHTRLKPSDLGDGQFTADELNKMLPEDYWPIIFKICRPSGAPSFPNLKIIIAFLLSMPCSNVIAEREFSSLKLIKTLQRNRLHNLTITSLMRVKHMLKNKNKNASDVPIDASMINDILKVKANVSIAEGIQLERRQQLNEQKSLQQIDSDDADESD